MKRSYWTRACFAGLMGLLAVTLLCQTASAQTWGTTNWAIPLTNNVFPTPAISPDGTTIYAMDNYSYVYAINAADGTIIRKWGRVGNGCWGSPVLSRDGSTLYVAAGNPNNLYSLKTADGTTNAVGGIPGASDTTPALFERPLTSTDANAGYLFVGDYSNNFTCFAINNLTTPVWTRKMAGYMDTGASIGPDGMVYVGNSSNQLIAFDMQGNTNYVWYLPPDPAFANYGDSYSSPAFGEVNGAAVMYMINRDYKMYSISLATKATNWVGGVVGNTPGAGGSYASPVIGPDGFVYMAHEAPQGILRFNPTTGAFTTNRTAGSLWTTPAIGANGTLFVGDQGTPYFYALNPTNGVTNALWSMTGIIYSPATIGPNGTVYVGTYGARLFALNNTEPLASENSFWPKKFQNMRNTSLSKPSAATITSVSIVGSDTLIGWSASPVAMEYLVYKNTTTNFGTATLVATLSWTNTAYTDAGEGALKYYWVRARNDSGLSTVSAYAIGGLPPTGVVASDGTYTDKIQILWDAVSGPASYAVWRNTSDDLATATMIYGGVTLDAASAAADGTYYVVYDDATATAGINYYYWVEAINAAGATSFSESDHGYLGVVGPLVTANGLLGTVSLVSGDAVTVAIQMMHVDPYVGNNVDWWVLAFAYTGQWYYMNNVYQWTSFNGNLATCHPVYQGPLANVASAPVLSGVLGVGTYTFWFAVDYPMNGVMNGTAMLYNSVNVVVQ